jgi:hypothetical protein
MADTKPDMQGGGEPGKQQAPPDDVRHIYGPRPVGALVPRLVRAAFRKRSPATAQVIADWEAIVGPMLAEVTTPRRLAAGTLTLACAGPVALELQHLAPALIERINAQLGRAVVERLRFVQDPRPPPLRASPSPPVANEAAERAVARVPEGPLRDALLALGRAVLTRRR